MHGTKGFGRSPRVGTCAERPANASEASLAKSEQPIVFVVDDNADVREGIRQLVESVGLRCEVFTTPSEFLRRNPTKSPACLILDVRLPEINGLALQAQLANNIPVIVITGHGDIPMAVRAMQEGAIDFLTKPVSEQQLLDAIHAGLDQHKKQLEQETGLNGLRTSFESLTPREKEILPLVVAGLLNKQIAAEVGLSEVTVKVHRHKMIAKLNAKSVPDLVRMAEALGIRKGDSGH